MWNFVEYQRDGKPRDFIYIRDVGFWRCKEVGRWEKVFFGLGDNFLDISPLSRFMQTGRDYGFAAMQREYNRAMSQRPVRTYFWPFDPTGGETKPEEKSPMDKALDDFIAKRKAKRALMDNPPGEPDPTYRKEMYDLDRAMRKLPNHITAIHSRGTPMCRGGYVE